MSNDLPEFSNWNPLSIEAIESKLRGIEWILAGGYALELFYGNPYRFHGDIDIITKREQQKKLLNYFSIDRLWVAFKGELTPFSPFIFYEKPIQDIWVLSEGRKYWCLQIMLIDEIDGNWIYKRNSKIQLPFSNIYFVKEDLKIIKPEIQLLYKSLRIRDKDQLDYEIIYPMLSVGAKEWLKGSLIICYEGDHKWS